MLRGSPHPSLGTENVDAIDAKPGSRTDRLRECSPTRNPRNKCEALGEERKRVPQPLMFYIYFTRAFVFCPVNGCFPTFVVVVVVQIKSKSSIQWARSVEDICKEQIVSCTTKRGLAPCKTKGEQRSAVECDLAWR